MSILDQVEILGVNGEGTCWEVEILEVHGQGLSSSSSLAFYIQSIISSIQFGSYQGIGFWVKNKLLQGLKGEIDVNHPGRSN